MRKLFLENISFLHLRSVFVRHVTCQAQFLTFITVQILPWVPEVFFFLRAKRASNPAKPRQTGETIETPSYNTSTGLWNQGVQIYEMLEKHFFF